MKRLRKLIACVITMTLVVSLAVGCGAKKSDDTSSSSTTKLDTSKKVELNLYLMGDAPKDNDAIMAQFNKLTERDLNCTVKITYSTWTDFSTKYNLMLTSGQNMDLVYSADWLTYATYAKKGAFMDLTALIPKYAPKLNTGIAKDRWDGVKVDEKVYAIPNQNPEYVQQALLYREDLRKKYNLPEITSVDTMEQYLAGIKKNDTTIMPTNESGAAVFDNMFMFTTPYEVVDAGGSATSSLVIDPKNPHKLLETVNVPEFKPFMEKMKSWADQGFWSKSALSSNEDGVVSLENGKAAASFNSTLAKAKGEVEKLEKAHSDWKIGVFEYNRLVKNKVHGSAPTQNLTVIPTVSANPERGLALVEKLQTDKEYNDLMGLGIKGLTYDLTADDKLDMTKIDTAKHTAPSSWAWANKSFARQQVGSWSEWQSRIDANAKLAIPNILYGFVLNTDLIQNEYAAVAQVKNQYGKPLEAGLVKDVEQAYNTFVSQSKAAGLEKYHDEVQKQLDDYLNKKGIK